LLPLALFKAAEQRLLVTNGAPLSASVLLNPACSNTVAVPSSITPHLLHAALPIDAALSTNLAASWQTRWRQHQTERGLHALARSSFTPAVANAVF
jgi:hypothetical protein